MQSTMAVGTAQTTGACLTPQRLLAALLMVSVCAAYNFANLRPNRAVVDGAADEVAAMPIRRRDVSIRADATDSVVPAKKCWLSWPSSSDEDTRFVWPEVKRPQPHPHPHPHPQQEQRQAQNTLASAIVQHALGHHLGLGSRRSTSSAGPSQSYLAPPQCRPDDAFDREGGNAWRADGGTGAKDREHDGENASASGETSILPEEAVQYNVSSLGQPDPLASHPTRLDYDHDVRVSDGGHRFEGDDDNNDDEAAKRKNAKGSIETRVNGTLAGLGSVGAVVSVGWHGGSNSRASSSNSSANNTTAPPPPAPPSCASQPTSSPRPQPSATSDGVSGMWLAFTSCDAITGGYTLRADQLSTSNNAVFANVTVRTNVTIDSAGHVSVTLIVGNTEQGKEYGARNSSASAAAAAAAARAWERYTPQSDPPVAPDKPAIRCRESTEEANMYGAEAAFVLRCHSETH